MHLLLQRQRDRGRTPASLRAIFGIAVSASILTLASGCNKTTTDEARASSQTSLAGKPRALMFIFGDRGDPRVLPIATLANGEIKPITLDSAGWRNFDRLYFAAGNKLPVYANGKSFGDAVVRRGMWDEKTPLYKLPACRALRPLAAATLDSTPEAAVMLEMLAVSDPFPTSPVRPLIVPSDVDSARAVTIRVAQHEGLTSSARAELDEVLKPFYTGVSTHPTLVGSYLERGSGLNGKPRHVFMIADWLDASNGYVQTFVHVPADSAREFRRLIDHADFTGDGVDEIVLEGWTPGSDSFLIFLQYKGGHWREAARGANSWCADQKD
ncbi:MAG: hypothetical protein ABIY52_08755 [Gemmatimonadaceae bacterium]